MSKNKTHTSPWLYKRDTKGKVRKWRYVVVDDQYHTEQGVDAAGAKTAVNLPTTCEGKNLGKANATDGHAQALKEAQAKYDKKLREGYFVDRELVDNKFQSPMLAHSYAEQVEKGAVTFPVAVECKLNGVRALYRQRGALVSRKNKQFNTVPHIVDALDSIMPKGIQLDGELFNECFRENLNQLTHLANVTCTEPSSERLQESAASVQYHVYDAYNFTDGAGERITCDTPFVVRRRALSALLSGMGEHLPAFIKLVDFSYAASHQEVVAYTDRLIQSGHEGSIVRALQAPYEFKRSLGLLKLKKFIDREFEIVELQEGKGNWQGCVKRVICRLPEDLLEFAAARGDKDKDTFASNIEGDRDYLKTLWATRDQYSGKLATVKFQNISDRGVPQIPYVISIRDYEG